MARGEQHQHDVHLVLRVEGDELTDAFLEEVTLEVLERIEERAADLALAAVASTDLDAQTITLIFQIDVAPNGAFERMSQILAAINSGNDKVNMQRADVEDRALVPA